jgi:hypothetical protein
MTLLGPQSPPKLVCPFQEVETFDRNVSNKIHKNLVTKKHSSKGKPEVTACSHITSDSKTLICPLIASDEIVAAMNAKTSDSFPIVVTTTPAIP